MGSLTGKHEIFFGVVGGPFLLSTRGGDALAFLHLKLMTEFPNTPAYALRLYLPFPLNNCLPGLLTIQCSREASGTLGLLDNHVSH